MGVGEGPDVLALDPVLHRLYVASESGTVTVFEIAGTVRKLVEGNAGPDAHSVAVDPETHVAYLPLTGGIIVAAGISSQLFARVGTKPIARMALTA